VVVGGPGAHSTATFTTPFSSRYSTVNRPVTWTEYPDELRTPCLLSHVYTLLCNLTVELSGAHADA
jgi:hypothetical protein